jgi:hypothetical protein
MEHMTTTKRKTSTPISVTDLKARLALLKANGVTFYSDGLLELHITGKPQVPAKKPEAIDQPVELGQV